MAEASQVDPLPATAGSLVADPVSWVLLVVTVVVIIAVVLTLLRAIRGPSVFDRILAVNAMGSTSVGLVALMGFLNERPDFLDVALVYALINFIATIAVLKYIEFKRLG